MEGEKILMARKIRKVAVLGAGTMGASIAAHLANVGIPCYLLDIVLPEVSEEEQAAGITREDKTFRNKLAVAAIKNLTKMRPAAFYDKKDVNLLIPRNLEDDLDKLAEVDWVIEVVVERLDIKKQLFEKVAQNIKPGTIVTTNTSGFSINAMVEERSAEFKKNFLGTHFFNPPRYMKLLEVIPGRDTAPEIVETLVAFGDKVLGKGVVLAKDTPNFIANRIGVYGLLEIVAAMEQDGLMVEEVDALTGLAMGRPKSASFRTMNMVGLDVFLHAAETVKNSATEEWEIKAFEIPSFMQEMVAKKLLGEKTKLGFYKVEEKDGKKDILAIDYKTLSYRPKEKAKFACLEASKKAKSKADNIKALVNADDRGSAFAWKILRSVIIYAAIKLEEIADDIVAVDRAMRWGFNWEQGPFEIWDAIGVKEAAERIEKDGLEVPAVVKSLLGAGIDSFYKKEKGITAYFDQKSKQYRLLDPPAGII
ncbi:3-hydroxyacyl-CoA dehydrogenase family protein [Thermodesulfovibrionales bacterium]|nr:3-hydroxyacyl-CoA dehydrogenase family protein [Thermodesulfovibrionales bacterium]